MRFSHLIKSFSFAELLKGMGVTGRYLFRPKACVNTNGFEVDAIHTLLERIAEGLATLHECGGHQRRQSGLILDIEGPRWQRVQADDGRRDFGRWVECLTWHVE